VSTLAPQIGAADALVIEATFLDRDSALARARGHLTAAAAARLACEAGVGELLLTHISGRYRPEEIMAEAAALFPETRVVADFDRFAIAARTNRSRAGADELDQSGDLDDNPATLPAERAAR
jgi:ribonuclease BN (tRNA processing enzyme)